MVAATVPVAPGSGWFQVPAPGEFLGWRADMREGLNIARQGADRAVPALAVRLVCQSAGSPLPFPRHPAATAGHQARVLRRQRLGLGGGQWPIYRVFPVTTIWPVLCHLAGLLLAAPLPVGRHFRCAQGFGHDKRSCQGQGAAGQADQARRGPKMGSECRNGLPKDYRALSHDCLLIGSGGGCFHGDLQPFTQGAGPVRAGSLARSGNYMKP